MKRPLPPPVQDASISNDKGKPSSHHYRWVESVNSSVIDTQKNVQTVSSDLSTLTASVASLQTTVTALPKLTSGISKLVSSTSVQIDGIPTSVKRIMFLLNQVIPSSGGSLFLRIGAGTTPDITNYQNTMIYAGSNASNVAVTDGFNTTTSFLLTNLHQPGNPISGSGFLTNFGNTTWVFSSLMTGATSTFDGLSFTSAGTKTLASQTTLGCIQLNCSAGTFTSGSFNILYE